MAQFRSAADGGVGATFEPEEVRVLAGVLDEMTALLKAPGRAPDAVTERLFPKAYESAEDQKAYEELMGDQLLAQKVAALARVRRSLPKNETEEVLLDAGEAEAWLTVLNDVRLAIGTRLDVTEAVMEQDIDPDDPNGPALAVLHWLGWVQESFLKELSNDGDNRGGSVA